MTKPVAAGAKLTTVPRPSRHPPSRGLAALSPGRVVADQFRIVRTLGHGGMSEVVLAEDLALHRLVALKFLGKDLLSFAAWRERFEDEARNLARVRHENVAQIYSFGVHEGWPYFAMEYVRGVSLADWITQHPSPTLGEVAAIFRGIAEGVEAIHAAGLVHHDLKPGNVLIEEGGRVVVTDLGLARFRQECCEQVEVSGTPRYMAPEQVEPSRANPEHAVRADVYQLGVTLFEMLTGEAPFDADDPREVMRLHCTEPSPPPSIVRPDLCAAVDRLVLRALEKEPSQRFGSALELSDALEAVAIPTSGRRRIANLPPKPARVLVVDDDPLQVRATCALLSSSLPPGSKIYQAADGSEALDAVLLNDIDVIILDLHIPRMSGIEVAAAIASRVSPAPKIVAVTADGGAEEWRALRDFGATSLLLKPVDPDQLVDTVDRCCRRDLDIAS